MARIQVFTRFARFAHWTQALLVILLMVTGFEINGAFGLLGYERAAEWHDFLAWSLMGLWALAIIWSLITGDWKQYMPTTRKLMAMVRYYTYGIFHADVPHPYRRTAQARHNPLQRLAYMAFHAAITPTLWITGLLYMFYNDWSKLGFDALTLSGVALVHTAGAFAMLLFFIIHVYLAFTGTPITAFVKAMITGYEEI